MTATPDFRIDTTQSGSATAVKLGGELDNATCPELLARFDELVSGGGAGEVVLDLAEVSFIDSAGMRAIIVIERIARERGISLTVRPPAGPVTDLLEITGIGKHVVLTPQADDAPAGRPFVERIELELAREPTAPRRARAELRETLAGRLEETDRATLTLLTSELVTNAVIHPDPEAAGPVGLQITAYADRVRIEVSDPGAGFDTAKLKPKPREAGGHGLVVVDGLANRWGTRRIEGDGFSVWFELDLAGDTPAGKSDAGKSDPGEALAGGAVAG